MAKFQLRILTAEDIKLDEPVDMIIMRVVMDVMGKHTPTGELGILPNHVPLCGVLGTDPLRIFNEGEERRMAVFGGVVNVRDNVVTLMTENALWPDEIDQAQAKADLERAKAEGSEDKTDLQRALVQVDVGSYSATGRK